MLCRFLCNISTDYLVSVSIPGSGRLGSFWVFESFSIVALSLELCAVYGNKSANPYPLFHGTYNTNGNVDISFRALFRKSTSL